MSSIHYILLNGVPGVGQYECALALMRGLPGTVHATMAGPIKSMLTNGLSQPWRSLDSDTPKAVLNGLSGREAVKRARAHLRAVYGPDVLARWLEHRMLGMPRLPQFVAVSDADSDGEVQYFIDRNRRYSIVHVVHELASENGWKPLNGPPNFTVYMHMQKSGIDQMIGKLHHG